MLLNVLRGFTVQAALDAPRFCISAGSPDIQTKETGVAGDINSEVYFEDGIPEATILKLRSEYALQSILLCPQISRYGP